MDAETGHLVKHPNIRPVLGVFRGARRAAARSPEWGNRRHWDSRRNAERRPRCVGNWFQPALLIGQFDRGILDSRFQPARLVGQFDRGVLDSRYQPARLVGQFGRGVVGSWIQPALLVGQFERGVLTCCARSAVRRLCPTFFPRGPERWVFTCTRPPLAAQRWVPTGWGPTVWPTLRDKPAGRVALPISFA